MWILVVVSFLLGDIRGQVGVSHIPFYNEAACNSAAKQILVQNEKYKSISSFNFSTAFCVYDPKPTSAGNSKK